MSLYLRLVEALPSHDRVCDLRLMEVLPSHDRLD